MELKLKDVVEINKQFSTGSMVNKNSIEFTLSSIKKKGSWMEQLAFLVRALLVDHPFYDGNKRTATNLVLTYFKKNNLAYNKDIVIKKVIYIASKNLTKTVEIERELRKLMEEENE